MRTRRASCPGTTLWHGNLRPGFEAGHAVGLALKEIGVNDVPLPPLDTVGALAKLLGETRARAR